MNQFNVYPICGSLFSRLKTAEKRVNWDGRGCAVFCESVEERS